MKLKKKIKSLLIIIISVVITIVIFSFVTTQKHKIICSELNITILDSAKNYFIDKNEVLELIYNDFGNVVGYNLDSINLALIEERLKLNPYIKEVEVYKTIHGKINIEINQRNPILRVINSQGESFYIGKEGVIMPVSENYTSLEVVASGNIQTSFDFKDKKNLPIIENMENNKIILELYTLANFINEDSFYIALFDQIYVTENQQIELVPKIGNHIVEFGNIDNYEKKLRNLKTFYKDGMKKMGWNKYSKISLKYDNQIVCTIK